MSVEEPAREPPEEGVVPPLEPTVAPEQRSYAPVFFKGCGFTVLAAVLGVGVLVAAKGDPSVVGAALFGVVFLLVILGTSGLTGFWGDKP
jgi:hypothetical protein